MGAENITDHISSRFDGINPNQMSFFIKYWSLLVNGNFNRLYILWTCTKTNIQNIWYNICTHNIQLSRAIYLFPSIHLVRYIIRYILYWESERDILHLSFWVRIKSDLHSTSAFRFWEKILNRSRKIRLVYNRSLESNKINKRKSDSNQDVMSWLFENIKPINEWTYTHHITQHR